jgi:penicillin-binding protein 1A
MKLKVKIKKVPARKVFRVLFILFFLVAAGILGSLFGLWMAVRQNLPEVSELEKFEPNIITSVYADDGSAVKEYAIERRVEVPYAQIPQDLKNAIIATEDPRFFFHKGVDYRGILRAVKENLKIFRGARRLQGGSTITQQLARSLFLYPQQTVRRKLKEIFLSLQIEKRYPKDRILEMYCNQFYLGHGVYGVETAANLFFGKKTSELNLEEAALIAGIFRWPSGYSPYLSPDRTLQRRNHVLNRMAEAGFITGAQAEAAAKTAMNVLPLHRQDSDFGAYFFEEVRKSIEKNYGSDALYRAGLKVYTTINPILQKYAEEAVSNGLRIMDKKRGWRKDKRNLLSEGIEKVEDSWLPTWLVSSAEAGEISDAIVLNVTRTEARVKVKGYVGRLRNDDIDWTRTKNLETLIQRGDIIQARIKKIDEGKKEVVVSLEQQPLVQGAFLAVDPLTGQIKAMVGGYSFRTSKFNRATQALRQCGSAIKPILYTAAIENQLTPATVIVDEPTTFIDKWSGQPWSPKNYDRLYKGAVTLRKGIEESRNVVTAKLLDSISPQVGVEYCRKFGLTSTIYPYLSLSLGTFEVTLLEIVSAYTVFPNKGVRNRPYFITRVEDKAGNVLEENKVEAEEVLSPQTAYMMTSLLEGVVQRGTAWMAAPLTATKALAGKTGTTDKFTDAWFIGFSPSLCAGVWVGNESKVTLGDRQSGAVAALPIWMEFFGKIIGDEKKLAKEQGTDPSVEQFEIPPNLSFVEIDRKTGLLATPICLFPLREVFFPGTEPVRFCSHEDHMRTLDYYSVEKAKEEH